MGLARETGRLIAVSLGFAEPDKIDHMGNKTVLCAGAFLRNHLNKGLHKEATEIPKALKKTLNKLVERLVKTDVDRTPLTTPRKYTETVTPSHLDGYVEFHGNRHPILHQKDIQAVLDKSAQKISNLLVYMISTGNSGENVANPVREADLLNTIALAVQLRRNTMRSKIKTKDAHMRQLQGTSWGMECPADTPEGENISKITTMSVFARDTLEFHYHDQLVAALQQLETVEPMTVDHGLLTTFDNYRSTILYVNGVPIGQTKDPFSTTETIRGLKGQPLTESVTFPTNMRVIHDLDNQTIHVRTGSGAMVRPVLRVQWAPSPNVPRYARPLERIKASPDLEPHLPLHDLAWKVVQNAPEHCKQHLKGEKWPMRISPKKVLHVCASCIRERLRQEMRKQGWVTPDDLARHGIIDFVDAKETDENLYIAMRAVDAVTAPGTRYAFPSDRSDIHLFTHAELCVAAIAGPGMLQAPGPHRNQSPRNTYQVSDNIHLRVFFHHYAIHDENHGKENTDVFSFPSVR